MAKKSVLKLPKRRKQTSDVVAPALSKIAGASKAVKIRKRSKYSSEYNKQYARIRRFIKEKEKQGFSFDYTLEQKKIRPTAKDVERLRSTKAKDLYARGSYTSPSGDVTTASEEIKRRRSEAGRKGYETRRRRLQDDTAVSQGEVMYQRLKETINWFFDLPRKELTEVPPNVYSEMYNAVDRLNNALDSAVHSLGYNNVMRSLVTPDGESIVNALQNAIYSFNYKEVYDYCDKLIHIARREWGLSEADAKSIMDSLPQTWDEPR